ncbi:protein TRACHEARY ELEMENT DIFFERENTIATION-RELATED 7A-like [Andrographis paniculata]|uniref:protein TRACHEARY ELEMENT DIFFERENTIATION-RELATED 7A-like n=1 Tax=Andrographis paniculata TaxID=175694 RepID=UPI0021E71EA3|nr:protein TRACHEARY ELEMENT DIFFERENTIATION-RELATED 7A-like [Andrographis paniculata]
MAQIKNPQHFPYFPSPPKFLPPAIPPPPRVIFPPPPPPPLPPHHSPPPLKPPNNPIPPPPPPTQNPPPPPPQHPPPPLPPPRPPHIAPAPPPIPVPGNHSTVIIYIFVLIGGVFFLASLAAALFCWIRKRNKRTVEEVDRVQMEEHVKVHEDIVEGPHGSKKIMLTIDDDVCIEEEIKKNVVPIKGSDY